MPVIRINEDNYELLKAKAKAEDRPLTRVITRILTEALQDKPANPPLKNKKVHPDFNHMKEIFMDTWLKNNGYKYTSWSGVQAQALNKIITKLEALDTSNNILGAFQVLMDKLPDFYKTKNVTAINGNFDSIIADIKRGTKQSNLIQDAGKFDFRN